VKFRERNQDKQTNKFFFKKNLNYKNEKKAKNLQPNEEFQQPISKTKVNIWPFYLYDIS
jgi:hypothetical protein